MKTSSTVLKPTVIALLLVFLVIGAAIGYMLHPAPPPPATTLPSEIPIGVLVALTGDFSSYGVRAEATVKIAESEINAYVTSLGIPTTFKFYYEDYETKPDVALQRLQSLYARGIKVVVGGLTSGSTRQMVSYADTNKILVIGGASTAPRENVAPPGDYIIRVVPAAEAEGDALVAALKDRGYMNIAIVTTEDTYSLSIGDAFKSRYTAAGGKVVADITYAPGAKDFTVVLDTLEREVAPLLSAKQNVAVFANMWEDVAVLMNQANGRNSPLLSLEWFGPDTLSQGTVIIKDAGPVATKVKLISVQLMAPMTKKHATLKATLESTMGQEPDVYALATYDAAWLAALSILNAGKYDPDAVKTALLTIAPSYWGATGNIELNEKGDRLMMDMEFWAVVQGQWQRVASYSSQTQQVTWLMQV